MAKLRSYSFWRSLIVILTTIFTLYKAIWLGPPVTCLRTVDAEVVPIWVDMTRARSHQNAIHFSYPFIFLMLWVKVDNFLKFSTKYPCPFSLSPSSPLTRKFYVITLHFLNTKQTIFWVMFVSYSYLSFLNKYLNFCSFILLWAKILRAGKFNGS